MNNVLLLKMVELDRLQKEAVSYTLSDEVVISPQQIKLKADEMIYIYRFYAQNWITDKVIVLSSANKTEYLYANCEQIENVTNPLLKIYQSNRITRHIGNITIKGDNTNEFIFCYLRVTFN